MKYTEALKTGKKIQNQNMTDSTNYLFWKRDGFEDCFYHRIEGEIEDEATHASTDKRYIDENQLGLFEDKNNES